MTNSIDSFFIPEGREVKILLGTSNVFEELMKSSNGKLTRIPKLVYTDSTALSISSTYKNLVEAQGSTLLTLLSGATNGMIPSGQFALQGLQIWESTDVMEFSLTVSLYMVDDAKQDVVIPAISLSKICVPTYARNKEGSQGWGLIPPGPNIVTILNLVGADAVASKFSSEDNRNMANTGSLLSVQIGNYLRIDRVVMTKVEPTFSEILDENYIPTSCTLDITFRTVEVVTTDMLQQFIENM